MVVAAGEIVTMNKAELIAKVEAGHDVFGELLLDIADKKEDAKAILDVISAAEARLVVALANVEAKPLRRKLNHERHTYRKSAREHAWRLFSPERTDQ
jgi:hypothetical protein